MSARKDEPNSTITVVPSATQYVDQMTELISLVYGFSVEELDKYRYSEKLASGITVFPAGQYMALDTEHDRLIGFSSSMQIDYNPRFPLRKSWEEETADGWLTNHNPKGEWLYGVECTVHPDYRGRGIGSQLIDARYDIVRQLNLRGMVAGGVIMDYHKYADQMTASQYVTEVVAGRLYDTNLTKQLHKGFKVNGVIPEYADDERSLNWAVSIVWQNPDYVPGKRVDRLAKPGRYQVKLRPPRKPRSPKSLTASPVPGKST